MSQVALKAIRNVNLNGTPSDGPANGNTLIVDFKDVLTIKVNNVDLSTKTQNELQTDGAIQRSNLKHLDGRDLQAASAWLEPATGTNLDMGSSHSSNWNQFEVNQRLFNVKSTYDESIYTKKLDKSKMTKEQLDKADRIAREIESQQSSNIHMQIERGQAEEGEFDEEDLYSGVLDQSKVKNNKSLKKVPATGAGGSKWERAGKSSPSVEQSSADRSAAPPGLSEPAAKAAAEEPTAAEKLEKKAPALNPNAKEFTFNAKAPEFKPSFVTAPVVMPPSPYGNAMYGGAMMGAPVMIDESGNPVMYAPMAQPGFYPPAYMMPGAMQPMMYPQPYMGAPLNANPYMPMPGMQQQQQQHRGGRGNPNHAQNK